MERLKLYMIMLGCTPKGRLTEQHDIFFGIGRSLSDLIPQMKSFWPEAKGKIHIDVWREVSVVDGYRIDIVPKNNNRASDKNLYFINLGGYKENEFEEFHYRMLAVGDTMADAVKRSKETSFYKHTGIKGAPSHIDEKFGIDVDNISEVNEILNYFTPAEYKLLITKAIDVPEDILRIGYLKLEKIELMTI